MFDNDARSGKIRQRLESESIFEYCTSKDLNGNSTSANSHRNLLIFFDTLVLFVTLISFLLCVRSLYVGHKLCREVRRYFARERPQEPRFSFDELQVFYSFWYFLMIITDLMIIPGTIVKILILFKQTHGYDTAGLLLGTSSLFSWFGILRYLTFFRKYNVRKKKTLVFSFVNNRLFFSQASICDHTKSFTIAPSFSPVYDYHVSWISIRRLDRSRSVSFEISNISIDIRNDVRIDQWR